MQAIQKQIKSLWKELVSAIDQTKNADAQEFRRNDFYRLETLLQEETANERQHRRFVSGAYAVSSSVGAKITLLHNVARGARLSEMPTATTFILFRRSAAEAMLLGYLLRDGLTPQFVDEAYSLDYPSLMKVGE